MSINIGYLIGQAGNGIFILHDKKRHLRKFMRTCDESEHEEEASGLPPGGHSIQSRLPGLLSALKTSAVAGKPLALFPGFVKMPHRAVLFKKAL